MGLIETIVRYAILSGVLALVVIWVYRAVKRGEVIKGREEEILSCESEKQKVEKTLLATLNKLEGSEAACNKFDEMVVDRDRNIVSLKASRAYYKGVAEERKVSNKELDNLAAKYSNALGRSNSKLSDIETALAGIKNDNISKTVWAGVEVAEMIEKLESILEEK